MKRIRDEVSLRGTVETITATDFRMRPGEVLDSVALGKTFIITKRGEPIARLSKHPKPLTFTEDVGYEHDCGGAPREEPA